MDILCAIDGTGPWSDSVYEKDFANSFVKRIHDSWNPLSRLYDRGPSLDGVSTGGKAKDMATYAEALYKSTSPNSVELGGGRIFLVGYSRGGAAAIEAAHILTSKKIPVYALLLFDAVDRSITVSNSIVPNGVKYCRHAIRSSNTKSRTSFGNTGLRRGGEVDYPHTVSFFCTHGAMGGVPWKNAGADGYIYEQEDGRPDRSTQSIVGKASTNPFVKLIDQKLGAMYDNGSKTQVTLKQEKEGTAMVETYMFNELRSLKGNILYHENTRDTVFA